MASTGMQTMVKGIARSLNDALDADKWFRGPERAIYADRTLLATQSKINYINPSLTLIPTAYFSNSWTARIDLLSTSSLSRLRLSF